MSKILITGSGGLVAGALIPHLLGHTDHELLALTSQKARLQELFRPGGGARLEIVGFDEPLEGIDAVVHLAGESIAKRFLSRQRLADIRAQRLEFLHRLRDRLKDRPIRYFIQASSTDIYRNGSPCDEFSDDPGQYDPGALAGICTAQEQCAKTLFGPVVAAMRLGIVLSPDAPVVQMLKGHRPFAIAGHANRLPFTCLGDLVRAVAFMLEKQEAGNFNVCQPIAAGTNALLQAIRPAGHRIPVPRWVLACDKRSGLLLADKAARPVHLEQSGFRFGFTSLADVARYLN